MFLRYIVEHVKMVSPHIMFTDIKSSYEFNGVCVKICSLLEPILIFVLVFFALFYQFFLHMQM